MKKNILLIVAISFSAIFLSCSNNQSLKISYQDTETLKDILREKESDTRWAGELEPERLSKNLEINSKLVSKEVTKDNQTVKILKEYQSPVYADLGDFGSLNNSILTKTQISTVNNFIEFISSEYKNDSGEFFVPEYKFNYQFFKQDLEAGWKENFCEEIPIVSKEEENKVSLFKNWIIGEPVKYENQILIPVRVYSEKGYINLLISTTNDVTIKIYNVQIEKWGSN